MKIDETTTQPELQKLYEAVLRQEFLRGTLLNVKQVLAFLMLSLLFPAMWLGGFGIGLAVTAVFCVVLFTLLYLQHADWGLLLSAVWLGIGVVEMVFITLSVYRRARDTRQTRRRMRVADPGAARGKLFPQHQSLSWHKGGKKGRLWKASLVVEAPADGIYAFLLSLDAYGGMRLGTDRPEGCCTVQTEGKQGERFNALLLYKLAQGRHLLEWRMAASRDDARPSASITQLNRLG